MNEGRRKLVIGSAALFAAGALGAMSALINKTKATANKTLLPANPRLGINFSGIAYWSSEFPFVDIMHQSSEWVSQPPVGDWGTGPILALDKHGWVTQLEKGCRATKILATGEDTAYPKGLYTVLYDGEGEIALTAPVGRIRKQGAGELTIEVTGNGMLAIDIISTNPKNYLRNIRVIMPGLKNSREANPWHPSFLKRWAGVACIRLMDMMATNNSSQKSWVNRPHIQDASYAIKGVPAELLIDLANRLNTDCWFCIPHMADDDYIKELAILVKNQLQPHLRAWVEYSNEVWNAGFTQFSFAAKQGMALNLSREDWEAAFQYNAHRSVQIFNIWQNVLNDKQRLVNVIASQAANAWLSEQLLKVSAVAQQADVLAIAPYVSMNVPQNKDEHGLSASVVAAWSLKQLFEHLNANKLAESKRWIQANKNIADAYGLKLVAYEAGQHLVGVQGGEDNEQLTELFKKANADKRMGDIYQQHLNDWDAAGGDLWCAFNSMSAWSKWGSWGLLESADQSTAKYRVTMKWGQSKSSKFKSDTQEVLNSQ